MSYKMNLHINTNAFYQCAECTYGRNLLKSHIPCLDLRSSGFILQESFKLKSDDSRNLINLMKTAHIEDYDIKKTKM